jgi:lipoic acid synthetase
MTVLTPVPGKVLRKPEWLRVRAGNGTGFARMNSLIRAGGLHTVCEEALCPNRGECWERGRATIMILGDRCTRGCAFCGVASRDPGMCDTDEPARVAAAVRKMGLRDIVITSVTRDDLPDGGAWIWAETVRQIREQAPAARIETLIPDFGGSKTALDTVLAAGPEILGHNLETVPSLYRAIRPGASYRRSLKLLSGARRAGVVTKTSLMLGLGETGEEILGAMRDARAAGCDILFLGQYLQPTKDHAPVRRYVPPDEFGDLRRQGLDMGFEVVVAGPLVRSSYHSSEQDAFLDRHPAGGESGHARKI